MNSPYDLSRGNKGLLALATLQQIRNYQQSARCIRAFNAAYDPTNPSVIQSNKYASKLEINALELKEQMRARE